MGLKVSLPDPRSLRLTTRVVCGRSRSDGKAVPYLKRGAGSSERRWMMARGARPGSGLLRAGVIAYSQDTCTTDDMARAISLYRLSQLAHV